MAFFGQNNNQQQSSGFGGFGSTNNNTGGFGQPASSGAGFGSGTTGTAGGFGGFGSGGSAGFGANNNNNTSSLFGQSKPAFGATATTGGGGLFGSGTAATTGTSGGFGGFGSTNTNNNTTGGGLFGSQPKPAFGGNAGGGGLFGGGNTGGFGSTTNQPSNAFGVSSALSQNNAVCEGTGSTPFTAFAEKDGSMTNHFQSISCMAPYKNFSLEELRLADYNQGRRYGNGSGQAGAFGSTNFGGFGQSNTNTGAFGQQQANTAAGGLFGSTTQPTSSPFGNNQPSGFGNSSTGGGLFGQQQQQQKPGGLFGSSTTSAGTGGGLFGTANNTNTGFGSGNAASGFGSGGGGLFGQSNNQQQQQQQQQSKPFSFGSTTATAGGGFGSGTTGFGNSNTNTNTGGGLFGASTQPNSNPFGQQNNTQPANAFGGGFGQQNQNQNQNPNQPAASKPFGGFGQQNNQEQKPGGLFGNTSSNTNAGGGLFGNPSQNNNQSGGGLFGQANNQSNSSSLFGQKPANTGGLFGQSTTNNNTAGSNLFGGFGNNANANQNQTQQPQASGLFGNTNNNQQKSGGLFGSTPANTGGGGLFGNSTTDNQQQGGGLFNLGGSNQQQPSQPAGGSLFGGSTGANNNAGSSLFGNPPQQQPQAPPNQFQPQQTMQTSLFDSNNYGSPSIFSGLPPPPQVSGPIATPINQKNKAKKAPLLPYYRMTPNGASRYQTPQKRGYGFNYSTYGTPGSASSIGSTPGGFSSSLLHGSINRSLGKSLSTSNLRGGYGDADSILTPGAFSAGNSRYGAGSMKRLTIDRSLRTDLFGDRGTPAALTSPEKERQPSALKKRVSFDTGTADGNSKQPNGNHVEGVNSSERDASSGPTAEEQAPLRTPSRPARSKSNGTSQQTDAEQVKGKELAIVPEDGSPEASKVQQKSWPPKSQEDQQAGDYWMKPSREQIEKMTKEERRRVAGFSIGRDGCGKVEFNEPVDLSTVSLNDLFEGVVVIGLRSLTVYPDQSKKPAQGKGLNVPSTIYLENSWPRHHDRKTPSYETSGPKYNKHVERLRRVGGTEFVTYEKDTGTWIFKVPHFTTYGFDYDEEGSEAESLHLSNSIMTQPLDTPTPATRAASKAPMSKASALVQQPRSTTNGHSTAASSSEDALQSHKKLTWPGAFDEEMTSDEEPGMEQMVEAPNDLAEEEISEPASDNEMDEPGELEDLNRRIDEQALIILDADDEMEVDQEMAGTFPAQEDKTLANLAYEPHVPASFPISNDWTLELQRTVRPRQQNRQALRDIQVRDGKPDPALEKSAKNNSLSIYNPGDLFRSLWETPKSGKFAQKGLSGSGTKLTPSPSNAKQFTATEHLIQEPSVKWHELSSSLKARYPDAPARSSHLISASLDKQRSRSTVEIRNDVPQAICPPTSFEEVLDQVPNDEAHEKAIWNLASILFDEQDCEKHGIPASQAGKYAHRLQKDRLISFWRTLCEADVKSAASEAPSTEERAFAFLSANRIVEACEALAQGRNYRLATLVAQIGGNRMSQEEMSEQLTAWRDLNMLSEISEPIRAIYSLLAGRTCICEGKQAQHVEDRARSFLLSQRFNLDWKRAFCLRLCYAVQTDDPIESAVEAFVRDLIKGEETQDPGDDILFTLLRLYASSKDGLPAPSLEPLLFPPRENSSTLPLRLSFQLYHALAEPFASSAMPRAADDLTTVFAISLDSDSQWVWALFILLHISDPACRKQSIQALLSHHAADIHTDPPQDDTWKLLTEKMKIPQQWIWEAKALHARAVEGNRLREADCLVKAGQWTQAHEVLQHHVGPECIIAEDWAQLSGLLECFKEGREGLGNWGLGGQIYEDFLRVKLDAVDGKARLTVLGRLLDSLPTRMHDLEQERRKVSGQEGEERRTFRERVALEEIRDTVRTEVKALKDKAVRGSKSLRLPSSRDEYVEKTVELSERFQHSTKGASEETNGTASEELVVLSE